MAGEGRYLDALKLIKQDNPFPAVCGSICNKRCENACACHSQVVTNLFQLLSKKSLHLSRRIEVLACRSIREKLLCFFEQLADEHGSRTFPLPFSLSMLADYISADRSAMMREMRKMREEDLISTEGRSVTLL